MGLFRHEARQHSEETRALYARYELVHTAVDFAAAMLFLAGSILFLFPAWETLAVWLFILGSICFAAKPTLKLIRELRLLSAGKLPPSDDR